MSPGIHHSSGTLLSPVEEKTITCKPCTHFIHRQPLLEVGVRPLVFHVPLDQLLHPLLLQTVRYVVEGVLIGKSAQRLHKHKGDNVRAA